MIESVLTFEGMTAGMSTGAVVILYKIMRDVADIKKDHAHTRRWVERIKAHIWPSVFGSMKKPG